MNLTPKRALLPVGAGLLGMVLLAGVYLGIVSLAQSPAHALELFWQDKALVIPILLGFGTQVALYTFLKKGLNRPLSVPGGGATTAAGGGVSTVAMVACCAHHVADVLPLIGLTAAAAFLAQWRIPFMAAGLLTNVLGIGFMLRAVFKERQRALSRRPTPAMENLT